MNNYNFKTGNNKEVFMNKPIHSDFIIHWTGKDIDKYDQGWVKKHYSKTKKQIADLYLKRLEDILEYGLWMTKKEEDKSIFIREDRKEIEIKRPWVARTCFTELKLSEARSHAKKFGRLGIGFKRFFLFDRLGSPMVYFHPERKNWFFQSKISKKDEGKIDNYYSCFLKHMCEISSDGTWQYTYFDESEWRIIYSDSIRKLLIEKNRKDVVSLFKNPKDRQNKLSYKYYKSLTSKIKPEYLIPLDAWFSMIIYPSLEVKNKAQDNNHIQKLIKKVKSKYTPGCPSSEYKNFPIELNLDACRNF